MKTLTPRGRSRLFLMLFLIVLENSYYARATKHSFETFSDRRTLIGPVGVPFGFNSGGTFELEVFDFELQVLKGDATETLKTVEAGFFLQRFANEADFRKKMDVLRSNTDKCIFQHLRDDDDDEIPRDEEFSDEGVIRTAKDGILLSMKNRQLWKPATPSIDYTFQKEEGGLYFLIYQVCGGSTKEKIRSTFELNFKFVNYDTWDNPSFLTAGEMKLPSIFFFFAISYAVCLVTWITNILAIRQGNAGHFGRNGQGANVYAIHYLMAVLLLFKTLAVLCESLRYHKIRRTGHAEVWSVFYSIFGFIKGVFLFTVILLIGSGWSFVKPCLTNKEKKMVAFLLTLQVVNQIALIVLSQRTEGENAFEKWTAVLHLVDILCCCAVLVPIVWQVNALEKSVTEDGENDSDFLDDEEREMGLTSGTDVGEKGAILAKLKLFRAFYLLVVAYIYATRILVYLFATILDYHHLWVRYFVVELVTLIFYVVVGFIFRPINDQANYSGFKRDEADDEHVSLKKGIEMAQHRVD